MTASGFSTEHFTSRGIGLESNLGCFVCGGPNEQRHNIAAFVEDKDAGERVVGMFSQGARLDHRDYEPEYVQVKVGACDEHLLNLERLESLTLEHSSIISSEIVQRAISFKTVEGKTLTQEELDMLFEHFGQVSRIEELLQGILQDLPGSRPVTEAMIDLADRYKILLRFILDQDELRRWVWDQEQKEKAS